MATPRNSTPNSEPSGAAVGPQSRFNAAVGERRGITDVRGALARLDRAERELARAHHYAQQLQMVCGRLSDAVARLNESVAEQDIEIQDRCDELRACECNLPVPATRSCARRLVMRSLSQATNFTKGTGLPDARISAANMCMGQKMAPATSRRLSACYLGIRPA